MAIRKQGAKGVWRMWTKILLHWCKRGLHWCKTRSGDHLSSQSKHLLRPHLTTLGTFEVSDPCSRHSGSQFYKMAAPILRAPGIFWFFLPENPMPRFGGGGYLGFCLEREGGLEVPILFLWEWGFFRFKLQRSPLRL